MMSVISSLREAETVLGDVLRDQRLHATLLTISKALVGVYRNGNKLLIAGNGGSAADAQHFAAEIVSQYKEVRKGRPAIALGTNGSTITAWANDRSFETIFVREIEAYGTPGDALVLITTSGNSANLLRAAEFARERNMLVIGLLGKGGGGLLQYCDHALVVPSGNTPRIQEIHIKFIHIICDELDTFFAEEDAKILG